MDVLLHSTFLSLFFKLITKSKFSNEKKTKIKTFFFFTFLSLREYKFITPAVNSHLLTDSHRQNSINHRKQIKICLWLILNLPILQNREYSLALMFSDTSTMDWLGLLAGRGTTPWNSCSAPIRGLVMSAMAPSLSRFTPMSFSSFL